MFIYELLDGQGCLNGGYKFPLSITILLTHHDNTYMQFVQYVFFSIFIFISGKCVRIRKKEPEGAGPWKG